jgi:hypothetical protein
MDEEIFLSRQPLLLFSKVFTTLCSLRDQRPFSLPEQIFVIKVGLS